MAGFADERDVLDFLNNKRSKSRTFGAVFPKEHLIDPHTLPIMFPRYVFRHVANRTNSRTIVACLIPPLIPLTDAVHCIAYSGWDPLQQAGALSVMNSLPFDWLSRRYVEVNVNYFIFNSLTFPPVNDFPTRRLGTLAARLSCVDARFSDFAAEVGVDHGPLTDAERNDMRAEIDALVARAYDLTRDELRFIFTDFTENAVSAAYRQQVLEKFEVL